MRFLTFMHAGKESWGVITDEGVIDLGNLLGSSLLDVLRKDKLDCNEKARRCVRK